MLRLDSVGCLIMYTGTLLFGVIFNTFAISDHGENYALLVNHCFFCRLSRLA